MTTQTSVHPAACGLPVSRDRHGTVRAGTYLADFQAKQLALPISRSYVTAVPGQRVPEDGHVT